MQTVRLNPGGISEAIATPKGTVLKSGELKIVLEGVDFFELVEVLNEEKDRITSVMSCEDDYDLE